MHRPLLVTFLLVGCGGAAPPVAAPATDACADATGLVVEVPATVPSRWNDALIVGGTGTATFRWCGEGTVVIDRARLAHDDGAGGSTEWAFDPASARLAHGQSLPRDFTGTADPGVQTLTVTARDDAGREITARAVVQSVLDPTFVAARDTCLAGGGTFGPVGMARIFACDSPTHDAGQRCLSSHDCEGACLDAGTEVTTSPPDGRTCAPGEQVRLHVGTCAATTLHFGCAALLEEVLTECVPAGHLTRTHTVCVD